MWNIYPTNQDPYHSIVISNNYLGAKLPIIDSAEERKEYKNSEGGITNHFADKDPKILYIHCIILVGIPKMQ